MLFLLTLFVNINIQTLQVSFKSRKLEKQLTDPGTLIKTFGQLAQKISQRLRNLEDADNLAILSTIPAAGCHELSGDRAGLLAVNVSVNYRIIFEPMHDPIPRKTDGGLNRELVTNIRIIEITDYH